MTTSDLKGGKYHILISKHGPWNKAQDDLTVEMLGCH